jgi:hypothetical protein
VLSLTSWQFLKVVNRAYCFASPNAAIIVLA